MAKRGDVVGVDVHPVDGRAGFGLACPVRDAELGGGGEARVVGCEDGGGVEGVESGEGGEVGGGFGGGAVVVDC